MARYVRCGISENIQSPDALDALELLRQLWELPGGRGHGAARRMPAPNPVSLMRKDLPRLRREPYLVSQKLDGTRYLLLLGSNENTGDPYAFLIDRAFHMYRIEAHVRPGCHITDEDLQQGTLIDGELMTADSFVAFDIVSDCGVDCKTLSYTARLERLRALAARVRVDPARLSVKPCVPLSEIHTLRSSWQTDGLIFMPIQDHIGTGMHRRMLKWKPQHTIDFWMTSTDGDPELFYSSKQGLAPIQALRLELGACDPDVARRAPCVVECSCEDGKSVDVLAVRPDKTEPNFERTVRLTLKNVQERITYEELVKCFTS